MKETKQVKFGRLLSLLQEYGVVTGWGIVCNEKGNSQYIQVFVNEEDSIDEVLKQIEQENTNNG